MGEAIPLLWQATGGLPFDVVFMDQRGTRFHTDLHELEQRGLLADGCIIAADNTLKPGAPHFMWYLHTSEQYDMTAVSLKEFAAERIEDWMTVARYNPGQKEGGAPPPPSLGELAFRTDRTRQRSCAGDAPGEVDEDEWACFSQDVRRSYLAAGINPRVVPVLRVEEAARPYVHWEAAEELAADATDEAYASAGH